MPFELKGGDDDDEHEPWPSWEEVPYRRLPDMGLQSHAWSPCLDLYILLRCQARMASSTPSTTEETRALIWILLITPGGFMLATLSAAILWNSVTKEPSIGKSCFCFFQDQSLYYCILRNLDCKGQLGPPPSGMCKDSSILNFIGVVQMQSLKKSTAYTYASMILLPWSFQNSEPWSSTSQARVSS
jgi:hypothetical protein